MATIYMQNFKVEFANEFAVEFEVQRYAKNGQIAGVAE
jgi:hypothetical protein